MSRPSPSCRALYVHVPFCRTLCGYCDFYSEVYRTEAAVPLVRALHQELAGYAASRTLHCDTVFVGGGTPTVLPAETLANLLTGLRPYIELEPCEFTVEANPATVTPEVAAVLAVAGVNRVSIGAQSFAPVELAVLERQHRPEQVQQTVAACRDAGIRRLSLDLMFGIPGQTLASWRDSLQAALDLGVEHLSCYGLTYEPGTRLHAQLEAGQVQAVDPDLEADMYELALDLLPAAGLAHYEISNFARPAAECRHNLRYWHNEPYVGIGPAAAGFLDDVRYKNVSDTAAYVEAVGAGRSPWAEQEQLSPVRRGHETTMLELRLASGIDRGRFRERFGTDPATLFAEAVARHAAGGLLRVDDRAIRLTRAGFLLANRVMADFV